MPDVLVSGHHGEVERWRREAALAKTRRNRPDLLDDEEEDAGMTDRAAVDDWIGRYMAAWGSNDPGEIGALFTDDADYFTAPFREPWHGREEIVREWLGRKDDPGTWTFEHDSPGHRRRHGVRAGADRLHGAADPDPGPFVNMWQIRFAPDGRGVRVRRVVDGRDAGDGITPRGIAPTLPGEVRGRVLSSSNRSNARGRAPR